MKLIVEGEISAKSYKKLVSKLKNLNKKQLWEILDHYIFHVMSDTNVDELLALLDERALSDGSIPKEVDASALDDDLFYTVDPKDRFHSPIITTIPTTESLEKFKGQLDLLYDQACFDHYIDPYVQQDVAKKLVEFSKSEGIPVLGHWLFYSENK